MHASEFSIGSELASAAQTALAASSLSQDPTSSSLSGSLGHSSTATAPSGSSMNKVGASTSAGSASNKRHKKKHSTGSSSSMPGAAPADAALLVPAAVVEEGVADGGAIESPDWTYDPNEPRYCVCNQVSYGDMVACDNPRCPVEWFHYPCVDITAPPKGKWYCPQCSVTMNRRQRK